MKSLLTELNPQQVEAVEAIDGPVLVLAGAGSGKTKALTHRIAHLIEHHKIAPGNILAITFTNKAAGEIKDRVLKITGKKSDKDFFISTFHSFCSRLLRREAHHLGYQASFSILDSDDQLAAIKRVMEELQLDTKRVIPEAVRNNISSAKNELLSPTDYAPLAQGHFQQTVARIYDKYQQLLASSQAMDFDDLLMKTVELFTTHPEVLAKYQNQFKYVLIDEYQDTNTAQYQLARLLADQHRNLFVVGDDWQSIYSWRGANFRNILNFHRDYPGAKVIKLERNYRSTQTILDAAYSVIAHNQNRSEKKLWTDNHAGDPIVVYEASNEKDEGDFIVRELEEQRANNPKLSLNDAVVLYRTNAQSRSLEETLMRAGLPYRIVGGVKFYDRREIKDILAFLKVLANPDDSIALERIINLPPRGIGKRTWADLTQAARETGVSVLAYLEQLERPAAGVGEFVSIIGSLRKKAATAVLSELLNFLLSRSGYQQMLKTEGVEGESRLENILELKSVMEKYDHLPPETAITTFLEEVSLISDLDSYATDGDALTLMTMHSAKGLEFNLVFIAGMEENLFPHSRTLFDQNELEEERRLCYVAITRARQKVYLIHAQERLIYGSLQNNPSSRFIADIPDELLERRGRLGRKAQPGTLRPVVGFKPGDKVTHAKFGQGMVISRTGDILTVAFVKEGIKNLDANLAKLKHG